MVSSAARSGLSFARRMRLHQSFLKFGVHCDVPSAAERGGQDGRATLRMRTLTAAGPSMKIINGSNSRTGLHDAGSRGSSVLLGEDA